MLLVVGCVTASGCGTVLDSDSGCDSSIIVLLLRLDSAIGCGMGTTSMDAILTITLVT
jgi:hypothetical protein